MKGAVTQMRTNERTAITKDELRRMSEVDIRTVNPDTLVDISDVKINPDLPVKERIADYIRQIGNPYCYKSHGITVKISFAGKKTLEECILNCVKESTSAIALGESLRANKAAVMESMEVHKKEETSLEPDAA